MNDDAEVQQLRRRLSVALRECQNYHSRLQATIEYIAERQSSWAAGGGHDQKSIDIDAIRTRRLELEAIAARLKIDGIADDDAETTASAIARMRLAEEECRVAELRKQLEAQRREILRLKSQGSRRNSPVSDLDSIVTDLFPERRVSGSGDNATMAPAIVTRLSQSSTASSSVNDDGGEGAQKTLDEIFDYISTRMLRGTLTESMFVRVLSVNNAKNKTGVFKQLFRVLRLYQRIVRISQDLGHQTETRAALSRIEDIVYDVMEVQLVNIYLCDRKRNMIECLGSAHDHCSTGFNVKVGEGVVGTVVENPGIVNVTYDDSDDVKLKDLLSVEYRGIKVNSMLVGPIADESSDTILGVIQCFNKKNGPFNSTDEVILEQIAKQAANILTTTLRFQEEKKRQDRNDVLMDIVKTVHTNDDIDEIISKVVEASYRVVHCDRVSLFMIDPSTNELWFKVSKDASAAGFRFPIGKGIAGFVASSGESLNIVDAYKDDRFSSVLDRQSNYQTRTILCIPICNFKGKPVAVLQCINKYCMLCDKVPCLEHQVQFEDSDLEIMQVWSNTFAREVASALQRKAQESSFQQAMDMDGNRSHMKDYIRQFIGGGNNVSKRRMALTSDQTTPEIEWPVISVKAEASELCDWTFDYFTKTSDEQLGLSEHIFDILELITTFRINRTRLRNFFVEVRKLYKDNPYHNFQHAFSVLHMVFLFVTTTSAKTMLTRADILALTVGAIGHDVGHPGMNNDFLINTEHELAVRYNDASVLENHHAASVCQLMRQENCDFLPEMTRQQRQELRKCMVEAILHTDQSLHKSMLDNLMTKINTNQTINRDSPADRQMLVNNILHCSDIGNPCLPVHMSQEWAKAIQQEFYQQATREKAMGLPYAAFMANDSEEALATLQINFINYVVSPIWKAMHEFLPELTVAMNNMAANKAAWEQAKEKAKAATD